MADTRRRHSVTTTDASDININMDSCPLKSSQKHVTLEITTSTFNRKLQVKTKQEDRICKGNKSLSPVETQLSLIHHQQISEPLKSSNSNCFTHNVQVSVSSLSHENQCTHGSEISTPTDSSMHSNFILESLDEKNEIFNHRPLLDLINDLSQRNPSIPSKHIPDLGETTKILPTSPMRIVPPKALPTFTPVIVHKKYQQPIDRFNFSNNNEDSSLSNSSINHRANRNGVMRSHTFTTPTDIDSNSNQISSINSTTCQSTPELNASNSSVLPTAVNTELDSLLSTSGNSLIGTSTVNVTSTSSGSSDDKNEAKRKAIALQMYETEQSYVEALKHLVTKYYLPMKDKNLISDDLINDIFYKIPEIHIHHTAFLLSLSHKLTQWDNKQTVGDILLQMFTRTSVIETYTSFVNNYKTAQIAIRLCRDLSSFNKFLEQQARDHHGRLTLRDLIIQPVQRIPRYELFIKDFLKCTNLNHPDYQLLLKAQSEIHSLAEQIDQVQREVGSTEFNVTNNSLDVVQDMIENLTDLVNADRYYIRHDIVTLQSPLGLKKDRCIFLFNDLLIITICKRRSGNSGKKGINAVIVNSPTGKQYIDNAKYKLIMKILLENVDLAADHLKKTKLTLSTSSSVIKTHGDANTILDKHRHLEEDVLILGQMTDLAKTITVPHQHLDESIKETLDTVNKYLNNETTSTTNNQGTNSESLNSSDNTQQKSNEIQLIINTTERTETIGVLFSSSEDKIAWEKSFLETKKILFEATVGRRNISFQHALPLPNIRPGNQFSCGIFRPYSDDLCLCYNDGDIYLINVQSNLIIKSSNRIPSSGINAIGYISSSNSQTTTTTTTTTATTNIHKSHHRHKYKLDSDQQCNNYSKTAAIGSLLESDSSDDDDIDNQDNLFLNDSSNDLLESSLNKEQQDITQATIWIGTQNGNLLIYECSRAIKTIGRKTIIKQLNCSINSILYTDNKVFLALHYGQLCVFNRDLDGLWDFDNPMIKSIEGNSTKTDNISEALNNRENNDPISVMTFVAGRLWCAIKDRIFVVCPNTLNVEHSFIVDDCHRHISCIATSGSSIHHVWIASQGSHEIRLYHATHFVCLLETSIRTIITQKLQVCDDIIRAHKLGCLRITTLYVCKETLWIGTSAGIIINLTIPQLIDSLSASGNNKLSSNSIQLKCLPFGHVGPVRFIISTDKNLLLTTEEGATVKTFVVTIGDGFEDYTNNDETLGKDDAISHVILWQL